ncbi:MAG: glutamine--tRNA ligase, partial [Clostridiales bacterium]|nr:glutamine--tRNA ligase [Clostridiales bacterium]
DITEIRCTYDPETRSGSGFTGRKVKGTIHWVEASQAQKITARVYDYLMLENEEGENVLNENSLTVFEGYAEPSIKEAKPESRFQFFRHGYFYADPKLTKEGALFFNCIVDLKSSYK